MREHPMPHQPILLAIIWIAFVGSVATVASANAGQRAVGAVATGGVFLGVILTLSVLFL
jgi:hypothetical protein